MLLKTQALILRNVKYGETSLILDAYTAAKGRQSYIIGGVRSQKAKTSQSVLAVASLVEMVAYHHDQKELHRIKEVKPAHVYQGIPFDVAKGTVALFFTELLSKTVKEAEENRALFTFIQQAFLLLDEAPKTTYFPLLFPIFLMPHLGFAPGNDWSPQTPFFDLRESRFVEQKPHLLYMDGPQSQLFHQILQSGWDNIAPIPKALRQTLLDAVLDYYRYHIDHFNTLNSHLILREVLG